MFARATCRSRVPQLRPIAWRIQGQPCDARRLCPATPSRFDRTVEHNASPKEPPEIVGDIQGQSARAIEAVRAVVIRPRTRKTKILTGRADCIRPNPLFL